MKTFNFFQHGLLLTIITCMLFWVCNKATNYVEATFQGAIFTSISLGIILFKKANVPQHHLTDYTKYSLRLVSRVAVKPIQNLDQNSQNL